MANRSEISSPDSLPALGQSPRLAYVVTVSPTIMDGLVVRWHRTLDDAEHARPIISASRNAVVIHEKGLPPAVLAEVMPLAERAGHDLGMGRPEAVRGLANYERRGLFGPLVPIKSA